VTVAHVKKGDEHLDGRKAFDVKPSATAREAKSKTRENIMVLSNVVPAAKVLPSKEIFFDLNYSTVPVHERTYFFCSL
jgi:hypothetical protein